METIPISVDVRRAVTAALLGLGLVCVGSPARALDLSACEDFPPLSPGQFGLDYRDKSEGNQTFLKLVEDFHFTAPVEQLISGQSGHLLGDLNYTLRRFPNHHRALYAMIRYHRQEPQKFTFPPACYLQRAMEYYPSDPLVKTLFGIYLHHNEQYQEALQMYQAALGLFDRSAETHYNIGLLYIDLEDYPKAREHARRAYDLGYQLPGLRRMLEAVDHWP